MKIYIASSFDLVSLVKETAEVLRNYGHEITQEWWNFDYKQILKSDDKLWYQLLEVQEVSRKNFEGIKQADCLLFVADPELPRKFNGANIELGYALALGKPCFSIGKLQRSAMYVSVMKCKDLKEFLERLNRNE